MTKLQFLLMSLLVAISFGASVQAADALSVYASEEDIKNQYAFSYSQADAERDIADALVKAGAAEQATAKLVGDNRDVTYTYGKPVTVRVKDLAFKPEAGTFEAMLMFDAGEQALAPAHLKGRYEEVFDVPVLRARKLSSDTIDKRDIEWIKVNASKMRETTVRREEDLIGRSPERTVSAKRPIRREEIHMPASVHKGDSLTMQFAANNMLISTTGEALEDGATGETIRVRNLTSSKVVRGKIEANNVVRVEALNDSHEQASR